MTTRQKAARRNAAALLLCLCAAATAACSGLSGEPRVVSTLRPAATNAPVLDANADPMAVGALIFAERCTSCHGDTGRGDGDLVRAGQIGDVPDFTDPVRREGLTVDDYYEVITNGRIENLMPPWKDALTDAERRAVAAFTFSLADAPQVAAVETVPPAATAAETPESTPANTEAAPAQMVAMVEGTVANGTAGGSVPESLQILLFVMDAAGDEIYTAVAASEAGRFRFEDVPVAPGNAYFASAVYNAVTFVATQQLAADAAPPEGPLELELVVHEVTSDPAVIEIDLLLNQAARRAGGAAVDHLIVARFYNGSDRVYREAEALEDGRYGSVGLRLPAGAVPAGLDTARYTWDAAERRVLDTLAVLPDTEHIVHVTYSVPLSERIAVAYPVDYKVTNRPELMLRPGEFIVDSAMFEAQGVMEFTGGMFEDYLAQPIGANETVRFDLLPIRASTAGEAPGQSVVGMGLLIAGVVLLGGAGGLFLLQRRQGPKTDALVAQIAQLDLMYQAKEIDEQVYRTRRDQLKAQLAEAMRRKPPAS